MKEVRVSIMKKLISAVLCLLLIFAVAVTAFADESGAGSVYASKSEADSLLAAAKASDSVLSKSLSEYKISIDEKTLMPIYYASLLDYAESGSLEYQAYLLDGKQMYASDMLDSAGKFAGTAILSEDDVLMYRESSDKNDSLDFLSANAKGISSLTGSKAEALESKAKFMFVEGAGYVYYIETDGKTVLISTNLKGTNGDLFNSENKGMVTVDENLLAFAKELLKKANDEKPRLPIWLRAKIRLPARRFPHILRTTTNITALTPRFSPARCLPLRRFLPLCLSF